MFRHDALSSPAGPARGSLTQRFRLSQRRIVPLLEKISSKHGSSLALQPLRCSVSPRHPLIQRDPKRRYNPPDHVFDPLPFPLLDPFSPLGGRKEPVLDDVALDQGLIWVVHEGLGGLGIVFLEKAVEVLAVGGDGDRLGHCVRADHGAGYVAGGCEEVEVGSWSCR